MKECNQKRKLVPSVKIPFLRKQKYIEFFKSDFFKRKNDDFTHFDLG